MYIQEWVYSMYKEWVSIHLMYIYIQASFASLTTSFSSAVLAGSSAGMSVAVLIAVSTSRNGSDSMDHVTQEEVRRLRVGSIGLAYASPCRCCITVHYNGDVFGS